MSVECPSPSFAEGDPCARAACPGPVMVEVLPPGSDVPPLEVCRLAAAVQFARNPNASRSFRISEIEPELDTEPVAVTARVIDLRVGRAFGKVFGGSAADQAEHSPAQVVMVRR